jgi:hypothetical protein
MTPDDFEVVEAPDDPGITLVRDPDGTLVGHVEREPACRGGVRHSPGGWGVCDHPHEVFIAFVGERRIHSGGQDTIYPGRDEAITAVLSNVNVRKEALAS